jgi:ribosome-associated protein
MHSARSSPTARAGASVKDNIPVGRCTLDGLKLAHDVIKVLEDKKAEEIVLLDVQGLFAFSDYFVICSATSDRMIRALADAIREEAHASSQAPIRLEGHAESGWVLADMGSVVAHIFTRGRRDYYNLEDVWRNAKVILRIQ